MENITTAAELKAMIQKLEMDQKEQGQLLKHDLSMIVNSFKPINLVRDSLDEATSSTRLVDNMMGSVVGMVSGYVTRKLTVGSSKNLFRRILGSVVQMGVTRVVSSHPGTLRKIGNTVLHLFGGKKENIHNRGVEK
ncbi:MAG TPA: hypothetical protein VK152_10830 [Paludibacter sp.]|nr:hypothetical protein [Paludibacter sp.]